ALERHATSKLASEEQLFQVSTMGFRGEALPSIASVSRLSIFSQAPGSTAMQGHWEGGERQSLGPNPCPLGTRVVVEDVFFNTPVRRTFIKSPISEQNNTYEIMLRLALSRPDISFAFSSEKKLYFKTPGNGNLFDCIVSIYGAGYAQQFIPLRWESEHFALEGFIGKPEFKRRNRKTQLFYVNRRAVRSPMLSRALDVSYQNFLLSKEYPAAILFLTIDFAEVDINVHPQKLEVKFRDEQQVFRMVQQSVKSQLEQHVYNLPVGSGAPARFSRPPLPAAPRDTALQFSHPAFRFDREINPPLSEAPENEMVAEAEAVHAKPVIQDLAIIGQLFNSYVLAESRDSLWLIDQHAAQERIMFNRLEDHYREHNWEQQILAIPIIIDLEPRMVEMLEQRQQDLARLGIELEPIGPDGVALRALPAYFKGQEQSLIEELVVLMDAGSEDRFYHDALAGMACKASVRAGDALSRPELYRLVADLLDCREYKNCPHGRPLIFQLSRSDIERFFKRA
ncbi:MAG: DNA mismatch repair endonuclease MutL, partial [Syntrophomonadaceae bacterium]|nr:DNA mismatch repair endonuclease MutL [Syntrophomonadaceae bacterium]